MLFWAVFTLGYIIGTFFTLVILNKKSEADDYDNHFVETRDFTKKSPWEKFNTLITVNSWKRSKQNNQSIELKEKNSGIAIT
ncbi:hypothetical protein A2W13_03890 [Candidatus Woesebacteria bacterium RBG_16_36_11]|uniref:Uncharacterized protein n=3 Tax=Candidatus Woeseibacteriota TaxID=1752722 RepID=A0A1F7X9W8_9BACT|nr:MAG: hypothetical protein A2Z67_00810 [Candidatus Woesebacteria bacterium RBG_13_36_22]OGM11820.1 MAG: hypothetical protein A2W13_03890 [Candidatus Woesebacteria bacterium RBG_16_36_11]OGM17577.1 MAG: hypothetical protein A2V55_00805 [Candidatus Woesebacteria bacterium RBG_19FT_COMBO_37_29]